MQKAKETRLTLRLPFSHAAWLKRRAEKNGRSMNYVVVKLVEAAKREESGELI